MDDEGIVEYFKTSPSVQDSPDSEEEEVVFGDAPIPSPAHQPLSKKDVASETISAWSIYSYCLAVWSRGQSKLLMWLVSELKNSSLLTEEDSHILHISLTQYPSLSLNSAGVIRHQTSWSFYLMPLLVALLAISVYSETHFLAFASLTCVFLWTALAIRDRSHRRRVAQCWQNYSVKCEEMLSLLTKTLRLVQETEVLSKGYSRPSVAVPVSRLELSEYTKLQCVHLRKRVFSVCFTGLLILRELTKKLCVENSTVEELDSHHGYLAFRDLEMLHPHMREGTAEEETDRLSLESLKDACNLLAVQNSEYLRRLTLVLGLSANAHSKLFLFESSMGKLLQFVSKAHGDLKWSLQYHKNFLFGEPPAHTGAKATDRQFHPDLQLFMDEIHCLDLKLQMTLQSVRDIGEQLVEKYSSAAAPSDQELMELHEQLSNVESRLTQISEHVNEGMDVLERMNQPTCSISVEPQDDAPLPNNSETIKEDTEHTEELSEEEDLVFEAYIPLDSSEGESEGDPLAEEERVRLEEAKEVPVHLLRELTSVLAVRNDAREKKKQEKKTKKMKTRSTDERKPTVEHRATVHGAKDSASEHRKLEKKSKPALVHSKDGHPITAENDGTKDSASEHRAVQDSRPTNQAHTEQSATHTIQLSPKEVQHQPPKALDTIEMEKPAHTDKDDERTSSSFSRGGLEARSLAQAVAAVALKQRQRTEVFFEHSED